MKLKDRMRLSIRRRAGQVVLRTELGALGSASQVSHALKMLQDEGELIRLGAGVYAKAGRDPKTGTVQPLADVETLAREVADKLNLSVGSEGVISPDGDLMLETGRRRVSRKLVLNGHEVAYVNDRVRERLEKSSRGVHPAIPTKGVAQFIHSLARRHRVHYTRTPTDQWAETVTRLAGDEVCSGPVEDLLIALKRAGKLSTHDMAALLINYLRERKQDVRSV
ncbi:hypothetical protein [Burkholderia plantarii]|uniref:Uncharacterized protein n=1 Tax=Burkholderia plantarii TaxID=41899 RepID=A0A0B6RZ19_BURPL|nr:hypothetical protein [Burkholderia plantarii]AJK47364.1 hypothetical protein BGL_1c28870 [Burkholderia plantarii]